MRHVLLLSALTACSGSDAPDKSADETGDTAPSDTGQPAAPFVRALRVNAYVAWDNEAGAIVDPTIDGTPATSALVLTLTGEAAGVIPSCTVVVPLAGLATAPAGDAQWRLELPDASKPVTTDCPEQGYVDEQYPDSDAATYWGGLPWALVVAGAQLSDALIEQLDPAIDASTVLQGALEGEEPYGPTVPPLSELSYWRGFAMSGGEVASDGASFASPLLAADVDAAPGGELPTGYYVYDDLVVTPLPERLVRP